MVFHDRRRAGSQLGAALRDLGVADPVVLGIPRGGVAVAAEVARLLDAPLDVIGSAKLGAPFNKELALAAVAPGGILVLNEELARQLGVTVDDLADRANVKERELSERLERFRGNAGPVPVKGKTVVLVDDGVATGLTVAAAIAALRKLEPTRIVLAVPVASPEAARHLAPLVDEFICPVIPTDLYAVGAYYEDFSQVSDAEVQALLAEARETIEDQDRERDR